VPTPAESRPAMAAPAAPAAPAARPAPPKPQPPTARALVVESDSELAKGMVELLGHWRISADVVEDGADALLAIFRKPPELAILGGGLASFSAPKIAEIVRRSAHLSGVKLVRVAVPSERAADGHDAHAMLEAADLPAGLGGILERLGVGAKPAAGVVAQKPAAAPPAKPAAPPAPAPAAPVAPAPAAKPAPSSRPVPSSDPDIAAAERLARIAVSDVILYNEAKFAAAAAAGNVVKALAVELEEARQHFNTRVSAALRQKRDFLIEELERRAAQRKT